mmetsp:Transcript_15174/g.28529  ORF Transcript_15174/g.28529 Transcript_15174/m.28529 type:complete len:87 (-) Transcript_15174:1130-1390(-)
MQTSRSKQVVADDVLPAVICYIKGRRQIYTFFHAIHERRHQDYNHSIAQSIIVIMRWNHGNPWLSTQFCSLEFIQIEFLQPVMRSI